MKISRVTHCGKQVTIIFIFAYLIIDSEANLNSKVGAFLLSFLVAFFIQYHTQNQTKLERFLKFGTGVFIYLLTTIVLFGFPVVFLSGLFVVSMLYLVFLLYGVKIFNSF